jgi:hypothetical protein
MVRRFIVVTLVYYLPIMYLPVLVTGIGIQHTFPSIMLLCVIFGFAISIVQPILDFLTIKDNRLTQMVFAFVSVYGALLGLVYYTKLMSVGNGTILSGISFVHRFSLSLNVIENTIIASLLLAIWGIITIMLVK